MCKCVCVCLVVCVCVEICAGVCGCIRCVYMWKTKVDLECHLQEPPALVFKLFFLLVIWLTDGARMAGNESQGFFCLYLPREKVTSLHHHAQFYLMWVLGIKPRSSCLHNKHFTKPSPHTEFMIIRWHLVDLMSTIVVIAPTKILKCSKYVNKMAMIHILCARRENSSLFKFGHITKKCSKLKLWASDTKPRWMIPLKYKPKCQCS